MFSEENAALGPWIRVPISGSVDFHVVPTADKKEHDLVKCPCKPLIETEKRGRKLVARAIVHKAWDKRLGPLA